MAERLYRLRDLVSRIIDELRLASYNTSYSTRSCDYQGLRYHLDRAESLAYELDRELSKLEDTDDPDLCSYGDDP